MRPIYVDAAHHIAVLDRRDRLHAVAARVARELEASGASFVTSGDALVEVLTYFSAWGGQARLAAVAYWRRLREKDIEIVPQSAELLEMALGLYERRPDKSYSMVDAIGMTICKQRGIVDVLSADHDFEQEGLNILLK